MKVSQYNSIYDFPSNPSQKLMFNAKSLALALVDCSKVEQYENYCQTHEEIPDEAFLNDLKTGGSPISNFDTSGQYFVVLATSSSHCRCSMRLQW